jgi:hypothetical protein
MSDATTEPDPGADEWEWPETAGMRPVDAARLLNTIETEATAANRRAENLKKRKAQAKRIMEGILEDQELDSVRFTTDDGRRIQYTVGDTVDHFSIDDDEAFRQWAQEQAENYFEPALRKEMFTDAMRRRVMDGEPLPPGVRRWSDVKLSRSSSVGKRR